MDDGEERRELQDRIMRYRMMERDLTDPLALGLLHGIVVELEVRLQTSSADGVPSDRRS